MKDEKRLLLVEDQMLIALSEKMELERYGYQVHIENSGERALDYALCEPELDLILMDINLGPGLNGPESAREILKKRIVPIVFLSSHTEQDVVEKTEEISSYGYVVKNSGITVLDASIKMAFKLFREKQEKEQQRNFLSACLNSIGEGVIVSDREGRVSRMNPMAEELTGYRQAEAVGRDYSRVFHLYPSEEEGLTEPLCFLMGADGESCMVSCSDCPVLGLDGQVIGNIIAFRDVSREMKDRQKLLESESRLKEAEAIAKLGHWELNLQQDRLCWSDQIFDIFEIDRSRFCGTYENFLDLVHPEDRGRVDRAFRSALSDRSTYSIDHRILLASGRVKYVHNQCKTFYDDGGEPLRSLGIVLDLSDRVQYGGVFTGSTEFSAGLDRVKHCLNQLLKVLDQ